MLARVVSRVAETAAVAGFLDSAVAEPAALVVEGEAGIGKTTVWLAAVEQARERGFRVLSARAAAAESVLAYGSLADLLAEVDTSTWADLALPQRRAMDRIMLQADEHEAPTDRRAVAAGFLSVVHGLAAQSPLLVALDDLQWLDASSRHVIAYAARRLVGRVGVLATVRTDPDGDSSSSWLQLPRPEMIRRITVRPLSLGGLHAVLSERLQRSFSRPALVRIADASGGNPFYALELGRAMDGATGADAPLPGTLTELVRTRIGNLDTAVGDALLAVACVGTPTLEVVARSIGAGTDRVPELLEDAENKGIVEIDGQRVRFAHPLLARGVYTAAAPARRRAMHRRLADTVAEPELRARHLALAATSGDPQTLQTLDAAAQIARGKGAPAAAAELLDLAMGLGGDTAQRRIRSARNHLDAGEPQRARALLEAAVDQLAPGPLRAKALTQLATVSLFDDNFLEAAGLLERALGECEENLPLRTQILISSAFALGTAGRLDAAIVCIENAVTHAERLGHPQLLSQVLSMRVHLRFLRGDGLDEVDLRRALQLEETDVAAPVAFSASEHHALLLSWTGQLEQAREALQAIRRRCIERGEENELIHVGFHCFQIELWQGKLTEAGLVAEDAMERARLLGGDLAVAAALTMRAALAAYGGQEQPARADAAEALAASRRCGADALAVWAITYLGFLEVSLGNDHAALTTLQPLLSKLDAAPEATEIIVAPFVPVAARALIQLGRLAEAEVLIERLERNGARLDRAWMLATGARGRAMLLAARGDVDAARRAAQQAMTEHDRLPMPFERARTQLLLGQLQHRLRSKDSAVATMRGALELFEGLGAALWARRAGAELARVTVGSGRPGELTPSERRVAELAASGMTNRDVAGVLFLSPKTVEAHLARVYRKLGIGSRAELGGRIERPGG